MAVDITALYCCLDDFGKLFADWEAHRLLPSEQTRQRPGKLSRAEMLFKDYQEFHARRVIETNQAMAIVKRSLNRTVNCALAIDHSRGGIPGSYAMLDAASDPDHPRHAETAERLDGYELDELSIYYAPRPDRQPQECCPHTPRQKETRVILINPASSPAWPSPERYLGLAGDL